MNMLKDLYQNFGTAFLEESLKIFTWQKVNLGWLRSKFLPTFHMQMEGYKKDSSVLLLSA